MSSRIFIVEDEPVIATSIRRRLEQIGYQVVGSASSGESAVRLVNEYEPDLVLMDVKLEGAMDGVDAAASIQGKLDVPVVFLTAYADEATIQRARHEQPFGYLVKPFTDRELAGSIEIALERAALERQLKESELRYRMLSEVIADYAFCIRVALDPVDDTLEWEIGDLSAVTGHATTTSSFTSPDTIAHLLHPDDSRLLELLWTELRTGGQGQVELRFMDGSDAYRWAKLDAKAGKLGGAIVIYGVLQNISRLRETQQELAQTRFEFARIVQEMRQAIWVNDADGVCIYANPAASELTGYELEELVGRLRLDDLLSEIPDTESESAEVELTTLSGDRVPVLVTPKQIEGQEGAERGVFYLIVDISRQKRASEILSRGARKLQSVFHLSPVPSVLIDGSTNAVVDINDAFSKQLGYDSDEIIGTGGFGLAEYRELEDLNQMVLLLKEPTGEPSTIRFRTKSGESKLYSVEVHDIVVEDEALLMLVLTDPGRQSGQSPG
jgi:PAS domain S-box-containing protein